MLEAYISNLEIFLVLASKSSKSSQRKIALRDFQRYLATILQYWSIATNISRFSFRQTVRTFTRFSQHELINIYRFFTSAEFLCLKCGQLDSSVGMHLVRCKNLEMFRAILVPRKKKLSKHPCYNTWSLRHFYCGYCSEFILPQYACVQICSPGGSDPLAAGPPLQRILRGHRLRHHKVFSIEEG